MHSAFGHDLERYNREQLAQLVKELFERCEYYENRMLTKAEVADRMGMTVSWLNNSQIEKAVKLRACGVRYGRGHAAPVRYPLRLIAALCCENEI